MMSRLIFLVLSALCVLSSCNSGGKKEISVLAHPDLDLRIDTVRFPPSEVLNLKGYYLSFVYQNDSVESLYGYNSKLHGLDCFDLKSWSASHIPFFKEGKWAVIRPIQGLYVHTPDSIWVYDSSFQAKLLNRKGEVLTSVRLQEGLEPKEEIEINCNYAMSVAKLHYDHSRRSLLYGVKKYLPSSLSFSVREVFLDSVAAPITYELQSSVSVSDIGERRYGNMEEVNISFANHKIIYNYPVESHIYVLDRETKQTQVIEADSRFTKNVADKVRGNGYSYWERHEVENTHFHDVMYLSGPNMYARLHIGGRTFDETVNLQTQIEERSLYLTLFDGDFNVIGEKKLPDRRYYYCAGWCVFDNGIALFVSNTLDKREDWTEDLELDLVYPADAAGQGCL